MLLLCNVSSYSFIISFKLSIVTVGAQYKKVKNIKIVVKEELNLRRLVIEST
jgi:hypothetical protein